MAATEGAVCGEGGTGGADLGTLLRGQGPHPLWGDVHTAHSGALEEALVCPGLTWARCSMVYGSGVWGLLRPVSPSSNSCTDERVPVWHSPAGRGAQNLFSCLSVSNSPTWASQGDSIFVSTVFCGLSPSETWLRLLVVTHAQCAMWFVGCSHLLSLVRQALSLPRTGNGGGGQRWS